jgi:type III secretion protein W
MLQEFKAVFTFAGKRFKDSHIPKGEMSRIIDETKTLQAILQIYRHFKRNTSLAQNLFEMKGDALPPYINFETLSSTFVKLVEERYPSAEKALQIVSTLLPEHR